MNSLQDEQVEAVLEQRATEWFVRHREGGLTADEQRQYMQWLRASPRHVEAYLRLIGLAAKLPEAIDGLDVDVEQLAQRVRNSKSAAERALFGTQTMGSASPGRGSLRWVALAATVVIVLAGGIYWGMQYWGASESIVAPPGHQRLFALADGSSAHLNSDTRLVVRYSDTQRLIELPEGQALFSVVHDARRPFIVRSAGMDVVALGTQFDVYRREHYMQVTVVEGRIEIVDQKPRDAKPLRLGAGEQVRIEDEVRARPVVPVDAQAVTGWTRQEVTFAAQRLEDVAAQFNRNVGARIVIEDAQLKDYRINGVFQAYDLDSFVAYLRQFSGIVVERRGDEVRVRSRRADTKDSSNIR